MSKAQKNKKAPKKSKPSASSKLSHKPVSKAKLKKGNGKKKELKAAKPISRPSSAKAVKGPKGKSAAASSAVKKTTAGVDNAARKLPKMNGKTPVAKSKKVPEPQKSVKAAAPKKTKDAAVAKAEKAPVAEKVAAEKPAAEKMESPKKAKGVAVAPSQSAKREEPLDESLIPLEDLEPEEVVLTDAEGRRYCKVKDCDQLAAVDKYCRYHYLLFWKKIQLRKKILADGKLEKYIEDLTSRYPDKYIDMIRRDLKTEKDFLSAIQELEIDDSGIESDFEEESENLMDEVRGIGRTTTREDDDY